MIDRFLGDAFWVFSYQIWSTVLQFGARLPIYTLNYWTVYSVPQWCRVLTWVWLSVTLLILDLWQYCVCCIRSGVTRCTLFMVLYLCRMCQCGLHAMLWSYIGILMLLLAAEHRSTIGPLFTSRCLCGTILQTLYSMVWEWRVSRAGPMHIYCATTLLYPSLSSTIFPFLFFLSVG